MRLTNKTVLITCLVLLFLVALCFLALPPLARNLAEQKITAATGRRTEIARVFFNPFTLTAGISGFRIHEKGGSGVFVSFSSVRLSLSPLSLPRRSFIVTDVAVASPYLHVVRTAPNTFNFSDLVSGSPGKKGEKGGGSYLFSLNNITVSHGALDFQDLAIASRPNHQVRALSLAVPFVSNIPYLAERYVTPHFSALVNGTLISLNGRLKPLTRAVEASVDLKVNSLDLPFYLGYLPFPLPVRVNAGKLTTALELGYRVDTQKGPEATAAGTVLLERLSLSDLQGAALVNLPRGELRITRAALLSEQFDLALLSLQDLEVTATKDASGRWNFQKLNAAKQEPSSEPEKARHEKKAGAKKHPLVLNLATFSLKGGKVHLSDATPKGGFRSEIRDLELNVSDLSTLPNHHARVKLELTSARGESIDLKGDLVPDPLEVKADVTLKGVPLKDYYPYLADTLTTPVRGILSAQVGLSYSEARGVMLEKSSLKGERLAAAFGSGEGMSLKELVVSGIGVDLKGSKARVENVELNGGNINVGLESDGTISAQRLLKTAGKTPKAAKPAGKSESGHQGQGSGEFSVRVGKVSGSGLGIRFTDRTKKEAPVFNLSQTRFALSGVTAPRLGPIPFSLAAVYGKNGRLSASGNVTPTPLQLKGRVALARIPLRDFDAYIPEGTQIFLAGGTLDTELSYYLMMANTGLKGSFAGSLGVHSFYCLDTILDEDLLKWESLELDQISGTLAPFSLAVKDVALSNFYARVIVERDGTLNLQHLAKEQPVAQAAPAAATPGAPAKGVTQATRTGAQGKAPVPNGPATAGATGKATPATAPSTIRIDTVAVQGGTLDFSDRHLKYPFDTTFYNLGGG